MLLLYTEKQLQTAYMVFVRDYVSEITHEKPRAKFYIDDKAIEFSNNWKEILTRLS